MPTLEASGLNTRELINEIATGVYGDPTQAKVLSVLYGLRDLISSHIDRIKADNPHHG